MLELSHLSCFSLQEPITAAEPVQNQSVSKGKKAKAVAAASGAQDSAAHSSTELINLPQLDAEPAMTQTDTTAAENLADAQMPSSQAEDALQQPEVDQQQQTEFADEQQPDPATDCLNCQPDDHALSLLEPQPADALIACEAAQSMIQEQPPPLQQQQQQSSHEQQQSSQQLQQDGLKGQGMAVCLDLSSHPAAAAVLTAAARVMIAAVAAGQCDEANDAELRLHSYAGDA